jgi:hypothetical protein
VADQVVVLPQPLGKVCQVGLQARNDVFRGYALVPLGLVAPLERND